MPTSAQLFAQAQQSIPGGVNSPVRAFNGLANDPIFIKQGKGAYLIDVSNQHYIDYIGSWGPLILGHAHPYVIEQVQHAISQGLSFGATTEVEIQLAKKICQLMPSIELIRMVNSGTEATMSAIRLARGFTGRDKFIKFEGCYHGHSDSLLVQAGSGSLTLGKPSSAGVPTDLTQHTLVAQFNNLASVQSCFEQHAHDIACIILEPIAGNMNLIPAQLEFLQELRQLCDEYNALLIFDEVMTGFRIGLGGAQAYYNIKPDLSCLGKIIGGGLPVGAFGGRKDVMEHIAPLGDVYQAGTLSGNPIAMNAGLATLNTLERTQPYEQLAQFTQRLTKGLQQTAQEHGIMLSTQSVHSMFGLFFIHEPEVTHYSQVMQCNTEQFKRFHHAMLQAGVYLAPSPYEAGFVSTAHTESDIEQTIVAASQAFEII